MHAYPGNTASPAPLTHAIRVIHAFVNNHLAMRQMYRHASAHTLRLYIRAEEDSVDVTHCQLVSGDGVGSPAFELSAPDVHLIDATWHALDQLSTLRWIGSECAQEMLRHIFPEYVVGTSRFGRQELRAQLVQATTRGTESWASLNQPHPKRAVSPINGFAPAVSGILGLYSGMDPKSISQHIHQVLASHNGARKLEVIAHLLLRMAAKAHAKRAVATDDGNEIIPDYERRMKHGKLVTYEIGPHTIVEATIRVLFKNLVASGWSEPWPSQAKGWVQGEALPRIVLSWEAARGDNILTDFEDLFYDCLSQSAPTGDPIKWASLINNPGVRVLLRMAPAVEGYTESCTPVPAIRVRGNMTRAQAKVLNQLFPYTSHTDKNHMTIHLADMVYELINYSEMRICSPLMSEEQHATEVLTPSKSARTNQINRILSRIPLGTNNILAMHILLTSYGSPFSNYAFHAFCNLPLLCGTSYEVLHRLKALSYLSRRGQADANGCPCPDRAVSFLAYTELAFGRSGNTTDWEEEYKNRCLHTIHIQPPAPLLITASTSHGSAYWPSNEEVLDPNTRTEAPTFYASLRRCIREICRPLVTRRSTTETMPDFLLRRAEWMASGSSGGGTIMLSDIPSYVKRQAKRGNRNVNERVKVAKRAWAETVPMSKLVDEFRHGLPREAAQASEKFENGKSRAIYGVEPIHYIINTYATKGFEEKLHNVPGLEKGVTGLRQSQLEHHRAMLTGDRKQHCSMLDYADFNRHHTPQAQSIIFEELADLGREVGACSDWQYANTWVAKAKYHMTTKMPSYKGMLKVVQGMFSGTKSTDLINTILNLAYFQVANEFIEKHYGITSENLYHVHQGDDVWLSNRNHLWARLLYYTMHQMGFLFQRSKQMFGEGRGEYLRVLYQNGRASGYLHRALANYILRPLQNDYTQNPVAWANTIQEGVATMCRRGLPPSVAKCVWRNSMNYWVKVRAHNLDKCGVRYPLEAIELAAEQGGLGCPRPSSLVLSQAHIKLPSLMAVPKVLTGAPSYMTEDWIRHVSAHSSKMESLYQIRADALREMSMRTSYSSLPQHILNADDWVGFKKEIRAWVAQQRDKLRRRCRRYRCRSSRDLMRAIGSFNGLPDCDTASRPLSQNLLQVEGPIATPAVEYMGLSTTLNKIVASSRFKSVSATATAYGHTKSQALQTILSSAGEDSSASQDSRFDIQYILSQPNPESLALLQRPGTSVLTALSPFIDANLLGYCSSQHNQVLAKYLAIFGSDGPDTRRKQAAATVQLAANTIGALNTMFERVRY